MDVVIATPMGQKEVGVPEGSHIVNRAGHIATRVRLRRGHVPFRIDGVVVEPVRH